jgi:hypothetical protein
VCPSAFGLCVVGVCDGGCCWGRTPSTPGAPPLTGCCQYFNAAGRSSNTTGIAQSPNYTAPFTIVPNPNTGSFTISGSLKDGPSTEAKIEVVDLLGKTVYTGTALKENGMISKNIVLGNNIANGVYFLKVTNQEVNEMIKFSLDR